MKAALRTQMGQQLSLTPQLLHSIRLLHVNAQQLELEVIRALEANPLLEREDDADVEGETELAAETETAAAEVEIDVEVIDADPLEALDFDHLGASPGKTATASGDDDPIARCAAHDTRDVRQRVLDQLRLELRNAGDLAIAAWLVDRVDDTGYLEASPSDLAAAARADLDADFEDVEAVRERMMYCDPAGFGARDLRECLSAQLDQLDDQLPGHALAQRIVGGHLELLARHDHAALATALQTGVADVAVAERLILSLDPKPGTSLPEEAPTSIIPDVLVRWHDGAWQVNLHATSTPKLRINAVYEQMLGKAGDDAGARRLRDLLQEARWLTRGLAMRYDTLLRTMRAIVARQADFFARGEEGMKPLTLREVADAIGMHESSVSRITTGKYVQTPRGTFELKYFFAGKLDGAAVAGVAVRAMVKRLIESENRAAPLADDTIAALLERQGVHIARRTVAKYREHMHIASAKERRRDAPAPAVYAR